MVILNAGKPDIAQAAEDHCQATLGTAYLISSHSPEAAFTKSIDVSLSVHKSHTHHIGNFIKTNSFSPNAMTSFPFFCNINNYYIACELETHIYST